MLYSIYMTQALAAQLVVSFVAGGAFIALLSLAAERVSPAIAGIILNLPSTMVLSFFFIGWTLGPARVAEIAPALPLTFGVTLLFNVVYVLVALRVPGKVAGMAVATVAGLGFWFSLTASLAYWRFNQPLLSTAGFAVAVIIAHLVFRRLAKDAAPVRMHFTTTDIVLRSCCAGGIIATVVLLSKTLGVFWGGMFSAFPAANLSSMLILHRSRGAHSLSGIVRNMPIGAISPLIFLFAAAAAFPAFGTVGGTVAAFLISGAFSAAVGTFLTARASSYRQHAASSSRSRR